MNQCSIPYKGLQFLCILEEAKDSKLCIFAWQASHCENQAMLRHINGCYRKQAWKTQHHHQIAHSRSSRFARENSNECSIKKWQIYYCSSYTLPFCFRVILSPRLNAIPCVLLLIRMKPFSLPSVCFSTLRLTKASSPKTLLA